MLRDLDKAFVRKPMFFYSQLFDENHKLKDIEILSNEFLNNEVFMEGIYWSSIQFYNTLQKLERNEISDYKKVRNIKQSLLKYIIRSCTRTTPFGIFAGVTTLSDKDNKKKRLIRIDLSVLNKIVESVTKDYDFIPFIHYQLNNTMYSVENEYRYIDVEKNNQYKVKISSIEKNQILKKIDSTFRQDYFNFNDLYCLFKKDFEYLELFDFYKELIDSNFLVCKLEISQTQSHDFFPITNLLSNPSVNSNPKSKKLLYLINQINNYIHKISNLPLGNFAKEDIDYLYKLLNENNLLIGDEPLFHVDLLFSDNQIENIEPKSIKNCLHYTRIVDLITNNNSPSNKELERFKLLFTEKYQNQVVLLSEVLDPDIGIGFPTKDSIGHNIGSFNKIETGNSKNNFSDWLWDKIESQSDFSEINIKDEDLVNLENIKNKSTEKASPVQFMILKPIDDGKIILENFSNSNPISILSRFSYLSPYIKSICEEINDFEASHDDNCIYADIIWSPTPKIANICRHETNFEFEIPIFYPSSKSTDNQILLSDILISVEYDTIVLFSKKHEKRIMPRLSNAYNFYESTNTFYQFLCYLQYQNQKSYAIIPSFKDNKRRFFPRITYKNIIIFSAHWVIHEADVKNIFHNSNSTEIPHYFKKWSFPQFVTLVNGDNELLLDTTNSTCIEILCDELKKYKFATLKEWLYKPSNQEDSKIKQYIIPLKNKIAKQNEIKYIKPQKAERNFFPGDDWIYFKIYCSSIFSDRILKSLYDNALKSLEKESKISLFFFIRYLDPHYHIRLRLKINSKIHLTEIIEKINNALKKFVKNKIIWKIKIDTYEREIEKYTTKNMEDSESIFHLDSLQFIKILNTNILENDHLRFSMAMQKVEAWLSWTNLSLLEKREYCNKMVLLFSKEFSPNEIKKIENTFRLEKTEIFQLLDKNTTQNDFKIKFRFDEKLILNLSHYIHMSINRWYPSNQRFWEYRIYYFCMRYYSKCYYNNKEI